METLALFLDPVLMNSSLSRFVRCYHALTDGWQSMTFHTKCDGKGPTVTIIKVNDFIFGGYTDVSWHSKYHKPQNIETVIVAYCRINNIHAKVL